MRVGFLLIIFLAAVSGVLAQTEDKGLKMIYETNWPAEAINYKPNNITAFWYKPETTTPTLTGKAGFLAAYKDPVTSYTWWATQEWLGVVEDPNNPANTSAIRTLINYNSLWLNIQEPPAFIALDADLSNRMMYTCTRNQWDCWEVNMDTYDIRKIYARPDFGTPFIGMIFEDTAKLLWVLGDSFLIWIRPSEPVTYYSVNPPIPPNLRPNSTIVPGSDPPNGVLISVGNSMACIFKDYKTRGGRITPFVYIGGAATLYRTEAQNTPYRTGGFRRQDFEARPIGAGVYYTGIVNQYLDVIYLGSSLGLGVEVDLETFTLQRIFFSPGEVFSYIYVEEQVSYWVTIGQRVMRVNSDQFQIFASVVMPRGNLRTIIEDANGALHIGSDTDGLTKTEFKSFIVQKTNCSAYSCDQCFNQDTQYCGVCKSNGLCTLRIECPAEDIWEQNGICPALFKVIPNSASTESQSSIVITGAFFEPDNTTCVFYDENAEIEVTPDEIGSNYLKCTVPQRVQSSVTEVIEVGTKWQSREWGNKLPFTFYNCSAMTCDECFSGAFAECGWCLSTSSCSTKLGCQGEFVTDSCPKIISAYPPTASRFGGEQLTLTVTNMLPELDYECNFNGVTVAASKVGSNAINCEVPELLSPTTALSVVDLTVQTSDGQVYTPIPYQFTYYDCNQLKLCDECVSPLHPKCRWCGAPDMACAFNDGSGDVNCTNYVECPALTLIKPASDYVPPSPSLYVPTPVTIVGINFEALPNMRCGWRRANQTTASTYTSATIPFGTTDIVCSTPSFGIDPIVGSYKVFLAAGNPLVPQTRELDFTFYTCNAEACYDCLDPRHRNCRFCGDTRTCFLNTEGTCSGTTVSMQRNCPSLDAVIPNGDALEGGAVIQLFGNFMLSDDTDVLCKWTISGSTVRTAPARYVNSTTFECTSPGSPIEGSGLVRLVRNNVELTNGLPFKFYDCTKLKTCDQCLSPEFVGCTWCALDCRGASTCPVYKRIDSHCPVLTGASPDHAIITGGDAIILQGGPFVSTENLDGVYTCVFDNLTTTTGSFINPQQVQCITPRRSVGPSEVTLLYNDQPYTPNSVTVQFFDCKQSNATRCTSDCTSQPYCGWCVKSFVCGSQAKCDNLWLPMCLEPELEQTYSNLVGNERIDLRIKNQPLIGVVDDDLKCAFGSIERNATIATTQNQSVISCLSPPFDFISDVLYNVMYLGTPLIDDTSFSFVDCGRYETCEECVSRPHCGWCLSSNRCSTKSFCLDKEWAETCPDLLQAQPNTGDVRGGDTVSIIGLNFINSPSLQLYFGESQVDYVYINRTLLITQSPKHSSQDTVEIQLLFEGQRYALTSLRWTYTDSRANTAATAGGVVGGLLVAAGLGIGGFYLYKRKYRGSILVNIREPDYVQVAYGTDLVPHYRMPADEYAKVDKCLTRDDFGIQLALSSFCPATEQDLIAKSMVYIAYAHDPIYCINLLTAIIKNEVDSCIQENTIFRGNSVASKMFKFYSRMTGIKYLWKCMARIIAELETLGAKELKQKQKAKEGKSNSKDEAGTSLLDVSMELDESKIGKDDDFDVETNILQLQLTCQKLFSVLVKGSVKDIPVEFRRIFQEIDEAVMKKFGSDDASFKAIGGFFFLRFVCPAITAPHYYGLLENPPNNLTQRQLVLISKTLQCLANMTVPGKKEKYMERLAGFIEQNIPKVVSFYQHIRTVSAGSEGRLCDLPITKEVKQNALATAWGFIFLNQDKTSQSLDNVGLPEETVRELKDALEELLYEYKTGPKKLGTKKKTKKGAAAPPPE